MVDEFDEHLHALRAELDQIDADLLNAVRARIDTVVQIALVKHQHGIPMMQPHRVGFVRNRARTYAEQHDMSPDFFESLYKQLVQEACRVEDLVIESRELETRTESGGAR